MGTTLKRSQLAQQANVNPATIRYYECKGLLPKAQRSPAGYRLYSESAIRQVKLIKRAQALGFALSEIGELFALRATPERDCSGICRQVQQKLAVIDRRIVDMKAIRNALAQIVRNCDGKRTVRQCGVLEALEED
jgi:MerR family copper efflux transcriptional regulator